MWVVPLLKHHLGRFFCQECSRLWWDVFVLGWKVVNLMGRCPALPPTPEKGCVLPSLPPCSFLPFWCPLGHQSLPGLQRWPGSKLWVTGVHHTNICVGSRPGAGYSSTGLLRGEFQGWQGLSSPPAHLAALLVFLTSPSWVWQLWESLKQNWKLSWVRLSCSFEQSAAFEWSNVCQLLVVNLHLGCAGTAQTRGSCWIGFVLIWILWLRLNWWSPCPSTALLISLCSDSYFQEFLCWQTWLQAIPHSFRLLNKKNFL